MSYENYNSKMFIVTKWWQKMLIAVKSKVLLLLKI